MCYPQNA
jgi:hypothetical protein